MVITSLPSFAQKLSSKLQTDLRSLFSQNDALNHSERGLYTYRFQNNGGSRVIHLRINEGGSGVLFVDVTDVVHLNLTAASMAKMALDGLTYGEAVSKYNQRINKRSHHQMAGELKQIYDMVERFAHPDGSCPTCAVDGLERSPVFSVRALAPYKADLALTYGCNNQCTHCYNEPERFDMPSLTRDDWMRVLDKLHRQGVPHIIFTGGEATLFPHLLDLIKYAHDLGMVCGLNSNGRKLSYRPYVHELERAGLNHLQITLGSNLPHVHNQIMKANAFEQTVQGVRNALDSSIHVITNTTLMRCNKEHAGEIIEFLYGLGIRTFAMNGMIFSGGGFNGPNAIPEEQMPPLLIQIRDLASELGMRFLWYTPTEYCRMSPVELELGAKRCNAGEYSICIEPNGDVLPCQSFYVSAGNILSDPWRDIWNGDLFRSFRDRENDPGWAGLPEKCWHCHDLPLCGGGCRIEREARDGRKISDHLAAVGCSNGCGIASAQSVQDRAYGFSPSKSTIKSGVRSSGRAAGSAATDIITPNSIMVKE